jgi:hypothetical protein
MMFFVLASGCGGGGNDPCGGTDPNFTDQEFTSVYALGDDDTVDLNGEAVEPFEQAGCETLCQAGQDVYVFESVSSCDAVEDGTVGEVDVTCVADGYYLCD